MESLHLYHVIGDARLKTATKPKADTVDRLVLFTRWPSAEFKHMYGTDAMSPLQTLHVSSF